MNEEQRELREFYAAAYPRLVATLTAVSGSRAGAEEVVQEAFVKLIPRWKQVRRYDQPDAWVRQVALRLALSRRRRGLAQQRAVDRLGPVAEVHGPNGDRVDMDRVMSQLSLDHRAVLVLHHSLGLPVEAVAVELGVSVGTVKSRLSRARAAFKAAWEPQEQGARHESP